MFKISAFFSKEAYDCRFDLSPFYYYRLELGYSIFLKMTIMGISTRRKLLASFYLGLLYRYNKDGDDDGCMPIETQPVENSDLR
jgi:hypothetical protein